SSSCPKPRTAILRRCSRLLLAPGKRGGFCRPVLHFAPASAEVRTKSAINLNTFDEVAREHIAHERRAGAEERECKGRFRQIQEPCRKRNSLAERPEHPE